MADLKHRNRENQEVSDVQSAEDTELEESPEVAELRAALAHAENERDDLRDQLMRTMADFQNFRKRTESDRLQYRQLATEKLVTDLLPVLDNFERTLQALESGSSVESITGGIQAVDRQLRSVFGAHSVSRIAAEGKPFDPEFHEAVSSDMSEEHPDNTVLRELEPGYHMAGKVIRPARVRVSKKP